ncbi:MAG: SDR family NAD(P)-dependent oxidoreductase [Steroidobacteraceae bacterium]
MRMHPRLRSVVLLCLALACATGAPALDLKLEGRTALVTGSTAGIGYACARALLREGARVIVNGRTQEGVDAAIAKLRQETGRTALGFAGDMASAEVAARLQKAYPEVDILVNNLGVYSMKPFAETTDADWNEIFQVNVMSGVRLARQYLPGMKARDWGRVIFISSESGLQIPVESIHYGMTKAAQIAVARGLAEAMAGTHVTVNSILPGPTISRGMEGYLAQAEAQGRSRAQVEKDFFEHFRPNSLIRRFEEPDEIAALVAFVASPLSSGTTGAALRVEGGVVKSAF